MSDALLIHQEGAVRILTNNNPSMRNAITPAFYTGLLQELAKAEADPEVGAIILTGAGDFFCSGGDLNQLALRRAMAPAERRQGLENLHEIIRAIQSCSKPVIAAVEGGAAGAGLSLALACDMLVAARNAVFSVAYVKVGLTPDGGATAFLSGFMSRQMLTELCLTGDRLSAERLHAMGAVNRLSDAGAAVSEALLLAARVAAGPARASARIKRLCLSAYDTVSADQMELEAQLMVESQGDDEAAEGIGAFFARRAPDFVSLRNKPVLPD